MTWAQRLRHVFKIDIEICERYDGTVQVIARIDDPAVVTRVLDHVEQRSESDPDTLPSLALRGNHNLLSETAPAFARQL